MFDNKCELPSVKKMMNHIQMIRKNRANIIRSHSRDQIVGHWIGYQDQVASLIGVKPNLYSLFFKDFSLWKRLIFGPSVSYQYRLLGPGSWDRARDTIMKVDERVYQGINDGKNDILFRARRKSLKKRQNENKAI